MEIESKYRVASRAALDRLAIVRRAGEYVLEGRPAQRLRTVYLDTPDLELARSRVGFRIRRNGAEVEATVKLGNDGGGEVDGAIHHRREWNVPLRGMPSFPYRPPPKVRRRLPRTCRNASFAPLLETRIRRRIRLARRGHGTIVLAEIALDDVEFHDPRRRRSRRHDFELEIELRRGTEDDLREIADALRAVRGLRPSAGSKLERGLRWAGILAARARERSAASPFRRS